MVYIVTKNPQQRYYGFFVEIISSNKDLKD